MNNITVARKLVTATAGGTAVEGFTLTTEDGTYTVSDGRDSFTTTDAAQALRTYADFIDTFVGDQDDETTAEWQAEINQALADAAVIA